MLNVMATESESHSLLEEKKKSGLLSGGGLGFTIGGQSSRHQIDEQGTTQSQSVSTVGSGAEMIWQIPLVVAGICQISAKCLHAT